MRSWCSSRGGLWGRLDPDDASPDVLGMLMAGRTVDTAAEAAGEPAADTAAEAAGEPAAETATDTAAEAAGEPA